MWFRKTSARREAIRADVAEAESLTRREPVVKAGPAVLIALVFFLVASAIQLYPGEPLPFRIGDRAAMDLRSPVEFRIDNPAETRRLREAMRASTPPVLIANDVLIGDLYSRLVSLHLEAIAAGSAEAFSAKMGDKLGPVNPVAFRELNMMDHQAWNAAMRSFVYQTFQYFPVVDAATAKTLNEINNDQVNLTTLQAAAQIRAAATVDAGYVTRPRSQVIVQGEWQDRQRQELKVHLAVTNSLADLVLGYLERLKEPTYKYDARVTAALADARAAQTPNVSKTVVPANKIIVEKDQIISVDDYDLLVAAQREFERATARKNPWAAWMSRLGQAATVLMITLAMLAYTLRMHSSVATVARGWALAGLMLVTLFIAKGVTVLLPQSVYMFGIAPTLLTAIILCIAFNQRFALGMGCLHALLVTFTLGQGVDFFLTAAAGVGVFCFGLSELRTRGRLIEVGVFASGALFVSVWTLGLARLVGSAWATTGTLAATGITVPPADLAAIGGHSLWAAGGGVLVAMFALAILPFVESVFNITTSMTLLELADANKPLLRRLAQEAPGTFNHSLTVGTMAEAAGNAIGVSGLMCRVGSYYHDVGKLSKPQYFIENQTAGGPNRHEKLSPAMSLLIIVGHVKDGIELAREYGLPRTVHPFIGEHHGTTLVEYFYHAARQRAEREGDDMPEVSDTEFRYPGPKPQTKETAIVMICDGCESVVRGIDEPTPGRIETAVHNMIMKRLIDGQFSECDLTMRELSIIEETLVRTLGAIHHGRVAYPKAEVEVKSA